ncbi:MAG: pilus assembly protein PilM [Bacillota bacterium]
MLLKNKEYISIDIGTQKIKVAIGQLNKDRLEVSKTYIKDTDSKIFKRNKITDFDALKKNLEKIIWGNDIKEKKVIFNINENNVIQRIVKIPEVNSEDRDNLIKYELEQYLPKPIDNYNIQSRVLKKINDQENQLEMLVIVMEKETSKKYYDLAKDLKLKPISLNVQNNSIINLISFKPKFFIKDTTNYIVLDIGYQTTNINIFNKNNFRFNRTIKKGISNIEDILRTQNIDINFDNLINFFKRNLDNSLLISEVQKIINYYKSRNNQVNIEKIYIYGGGSYINGMDKHLENNLEIPTKKIPLGKILEMDKKDSLIYLNAFTGLLFDSK